MSPEWFTLIGVLLGSIISQAGTIISRITSKESERKAIFEAKFTKAEELMNDFLRDIQILDMHLLTEYILEGKIIDDSEKVNINNTVNHYFEVANFLRTLRITDDKELIDLILASENDFRKYYEEITKQATYKEQQNKSKASKAIIPFRLAFTKIHVRLDRYRLNHYHPPTEKKKLFIKKIP